MRRREFIALVGGAAMRPFVACAQEAGRVYRLGSLHQAPHDAPNHVAFLTELRRAGFIEGQNLLVDERGYGARPEQFAELAREHVAAKVDVILCGGEAAGRAAQQATATIPIVVLADDMVQAGLASSLAKPSSNITGVSILATELDGKRQELLMEAVPGLRLMAALADPNSSTLQRLQALQDAARARGVQLSIHQITLRAEIALAIDAAKTKGAEALNVLASALLFNNREIVLQRVAALRLPAIYQWPEMAEQDGLLAYGPRFVHIYRDLLSEQVIKIFRGTKAADIPIQQPTRFELVVNLKTAKALGITVPPSLLARADEVIE